MSSFFSFGGSKGSKATEAELPKDRRILTVQFIEGRNLIPITKSGGAEPVISAALANDITGKAIPNEDFTCTTKGKSVNPIWGENIHFGKSFNLGIDSSRLPTLHITVTDHTKKAPMGMVEIPLKDIQEDCDRWFTLQKFASMAVVSGDIHLSLKWRNPISSAPLSATLTPGASARNSLQALGGSVAGGGVASAAAASANSGFLTDGPAANPEYADQPPNELRIVCIQGKNLLAMDQAYLYGQSTSDPYVYIKVGNDSKQTKYLPKTLNPVWMETLVLEDITDLTKTCEVIVYDYDLNGSDFMGKVRLPLRQYVDKQPVRRWFKLGNTGGDVDSTPRGEVELQVTWHFNPQLLAKKKKTSIFQTARDMGAMIITKVESDEEDDEEGNPQMAPPKTEEEIKAEEEAKAKAEEEEKEKRGGIELKDGDYQVQVHIIEARDLKAENLDGTSDPTVFVECFDQKQNTKTIYQKLNCVFDDVLIFNFKHLAKETVEDGIIRISVMDANSVPGLKSTMIGAYTFDATTVYFSPSHEIHRKWVALMDDEDPDDVGVQGYLKVSVQIIGPGDKLTIHNEEEDLKKEQEAAARAGGDDVGSMVLMPPSIKREWRWAVMTVYRAEALPVMDVVGTSGTDAFLTLEMGGGKPAFTKVVTVKGRSQKDMNPEFFQELWVPVSCPTATQVIKATVWDSNTLPPHQFIATFTHRWNIIEKLEMRQTGMHWVNLYGAPEYKNTSSITETLVKGIRRVTAKVQSAVIAERDPKDHYNFTPDKASQFKGRVLVNVRIEDRPPEKYKDKKEPFHRKFSKKQVAEPASKRYFLKVLAIMGSEIPVKSASTSEVVLRVAIGQDVLMTKPARCTNGLLSWDEELVLDELDLPSAPSQVPDIFLYICAKNSQVAYSFTRLKSQDVIAGRFMIPAKWYTLQEDKVVNSINDGEFPGQVLLKIGLGSPEDANFALDEWQNALQDVREKSYFVIRVHVYQARDIEAADSNGLSDPFIIVKIAGQERQTEVKYKTLYPTYYQVFDFDDCQLSNLREYMPPVSFVLWDHDLEGSDYLGTAHFNMNDAYMHGQDNLKEPSWIPFFKEEPGDGEGEILVKVEIFKKDDPSLKLQEMYEKGLIPAEYNDPNAPSIEERQSTTAGGSTKRPSLLNKLGGAMTSLVSKKETGWGPPDIHPETYEAWIEVIVLGLRNLAPYNFQAVQNPFLEFIVENVDGTKEKTCTRNSKKPSPANPNFLEKLTIPVKLPRNPMFAQPMFLHVRDIRLGGYMKPLIASGVVKMDEKIPGSPNYKPPGKQSFYRPNEDRGKNDDDAGPSSSGIELTSEGVQGGNTSGDLLVANIDDLHASAFKDETYYKLQKKLNDRSAELTQDPLIGSATPMDLKGFINDRKAKEDSGAGIFGALQHVDLDEIEEIRKKRGYGDDESNTFDDEEEMEPKWRKNRTLLSGDLESELQTTPFETYKLYRGKKSSILGRKMVGIMKGLIRIRLTNNPNDTCFEKELLEQLQKPQAYKIRLYVLEAKGLTPMDRDMFGKPAKSDPYLKIELGSFKFNDRENAVDDVVEVDFYKMIEMDTELPGTSQLTVHVMDKNLVGYDQLIGTTIIDLEDRWFDSRWQELGKQFREMPGDSGANSGRWDPKPVEKRTLYIPSNNVSQGVIELWVDILEPAVAGSFPPEDVALPPKKMFELRVVIWKVKNVPAADTFENMSDLFVKAWPEGCEPLETDTHWRAKKGKGSFNWRLLFDVELGHNTRAMKFPQFHMQLWDRDILKWNDCIGEGLLDMTKFYKKAFKRNMAINFFETKKGAAGDRQKKKKSILGSIPDKKKDVPPEEYYPGKVKFDRGDGSYDIQFDDGDIGERVPDYCIQRIVGPALTKVPLRINERVVRLADPKNPGTVKKVNEDDTLNITFDDGTVEDNVNDELLRRVTPLASNLKVGEEVRARNIRREAKGVASQTVSSAPVGGGGAKVKAVGSTAMNPLQARGGSLMKAADSDDETDADQPNMSISTVNSTTAGRPADPLPGFSSVKSPAASRTEKEVIVEEDDDEETGLISSGPTKAELEAAEDDGEAKDMINNFKQMTGLWGEIDPPDCSWFKLVSIDKNTLEATPKGEICYSIQIWPKEKALVMAAGAARSEPNTNPYLPPPVGRLKWSWNPFVLGSELCGPVLCAKLFCCLLCIAFILLMVFAQPFLTLMINVLFFFG